nr:sigma 54-interacting transcriptional regulator [Ectobacillus ponti]
MALAEVREQLEEHRFVVVAGEPVFVIQSHERQLIALGDGAVPAADWLAQAGWLPSATVAAGAELPSNLDWRRPVLVQEGQEPKGILTAEHQIGQLMEENRRTAAYFYTLADTINDSVTAVDEAGNVVCWNTAAEETYKIAKEYILGNKIGTHFSDEAVVLHRILQEGRPVRGEYHRPNQDTHVLINASPIIIHNQIIGGVAVEHNITNIIRLNEELDSNASLLVPESNPFEAMASSNPKLQEAIKIAQKVAYADIPVHLAGEPGSGKEMLAQAIHYGGTKADGAFVTVNCSVIPPALLEIELFGFQNDSFAADATVQPGRIEQAANGTLFIEEIDKMPLSIQEKLSSYLADHSFYRVGGSEKITSATRIIAAASQSLESLLREGGFHEKLYYHLSVITIEIPPLRARKEDIVPLVKSCVREFSAKYKKPVPDIHAEAMRQLVSYDWPGNVRELRNTIERMMLLHEGALITEKQLPEHMTHAEEQETSGKQAEALEIEEALRKTYGNKSAAASLLGISRGTLYNKIKEYGLS